jgi:hypothetical protein
MWLFLDDDTQSIEDCFGFMGRREWRRPKAEF